MNEITTLPEVETVSIAPQVALNDNSENETVAIPVKVEVEAEQPTAT